MADKSLVTEYQPSLSEWFGAVGHENADSLRIEDIGKRDRLEVLRQRIGLEYDRVTAFPAVDFFACTADVEHFIANHLDDLCALRLVPTENGLPKLRTRGRTLGDSLVWLREQNVDPLKYNVEFVEHSDNARWSTIFVVREDGIFGEIVEGLHYQLTQGNTENGNVSRTFFRAPDMTWQWSEFDSEAQAHVNDILASIRVEDCNTRALLKDELGSEFTSEGYLVGYFETLLWPTKLIFIDYDRILHTLLSPIPQMSIAESISEPIVKGVPAFGGEVRGIVRLVSYGNLCDVEFNKGDILVTDNTDVRYLGLMRKAGAIVTDRGGILSHAAIVARELGVPCVVGCKNATVKLSHGDEVIVDATKGVIKFMCK